MREGGSIVHTQAVFPSVPAYVALGLIKSHQTERQPGQIPTRVPSARVRPLDAFFEPARSSSGPRLPPVKRECSPR
eukprot:COSAG04_NODE_848_length_9881_cov_5.280822_17_plen_76_part_00